MFTLNIETFKTGIEAYGYDHNTKATTIQAIDEKGNKYFLRSFDMLHHYINEKGFLIGRSVAVLEKADKVLNKIQKHLNSGGTLNMDHWCLINDKRHFADILKTAI